MWVVYRMILGWQSAEPTVSSCVPERHMIEAKKHFIQDDDGITMIHRIAPVGEFHAPRTASLAVECRTEGRGGSEKKLLVKEAPELGRRSQAVVTRRLRRQDVILALLFSGLFEAHSGGVDKA